jgi:hypothetical protein
MAYGISSGNYFQYTRDYNVSALTVSIWAYATSTSGSPAICGLWSIAGTTNLDQWLISLNGSARLLCAVVDSGNYRIAEEASGSFSTNTWTHVAIVKNSSNLLVYKNGSQVASATSTTALTSRAAATGLGSRTGGGSPWPGYIAEFATWTRALSVDEIASLADGFKPSRFPTPDIYYPLVRDQIDVRNKYTLTATGSPTVQAHPRVY